MFQNWIQMYIAGHMGTGSSTATQAILSKIGGKGTRNNQRRKKHERDPIKLYLEAR